MARWCVLLPFYILLASHGTLAKPSCGKMNTGGYTYPSGDITLKYGTSALNITCHVYDKKKLESLNIREESASEYLYFQKNSVTVDRQYIHVLNESSISLYIEHPDTAKNDNYACLLKSNSSKPDEFMCNNVVAVGVEVQDITDFSCLSRNYENLTCTWTGPNNFVKTLYNISYMVGLYRSQRYNFPCPVLREEGDKYSCMWNMSTTPQYRQAHQNFYFTVGANNSFGSRLFNYSFNHFAHVLPNAPENLSAVPTSPHEIRLFWIVPSAMQHFLPGVHHRIMYSHKCDCENCENRWKLEALITDRKNATQMEYNLTGLPYAHCLYDIRVSIRSAVYNESAPLWSNNATYVVRTKSKVPDRPPRTNQGSFEIVNNVSHRDAYIYWQQIRKEEENGQNMTYYIEALEHSNFRGYSKKTYAQAHSKKTYALFKGLLFSNAYTFYIWSENSEGRSKEKSVVYVPGHSDYLEQPSNFIKVAHNDELYELSWKHPYTNKLIKNYTIFWCEWIKDRPFQCEGKLNWMVVSNTTTSYNQTLSRTNLTYQFAISANSLRSSSGMLWSECTVIPDRNMGKMKNVYVNRVGSNFIELGWKLDCYDRVGTIKGYIIYYCPIQSALQIECKGPDKNVTVLGDINTVGANVTDLMPYTTYRLSVAVILRQGASSQLSDPLYNVTAEAAPSTPPRNLTALKVTNNSISLSWLPPVQKNGIIKYYNIYFNNNYRNVDTEAEYTLTDLESYKNYVISVEACTIACSPRSNVINETTLMYYPGSISQPKVSYQNGTFVTVEWERPQPARGKTDFYEVLYSSQQLPSSNEKKPYKIVTENKFDIKNCDDTFYVSVRAVNVKERMELKGEWSKPLQGLCRPPSTSWMYIVFPMTGIIVFFIVFYVSRKAFYKVKEMKDVKCILPPGIDPSSNQEMKNVKVPEPDDDLEDHVLLEKSMKTHTNENSSGCSSGHESISESLQSGTLNSDSGTEQPRSPSPCEEPVTNHSLRQRKMPITKSGYVKADAIPQMNWTKPAAAGSYCVLGMDTPAHPDSDSPYVPFAEHVKIPFPSADLAVAPPTVTVTNEVKPPAAGYVPFAAPDPPASRYVLAGLPLAPPPADDKPAYVRAAPELALKAAAQPPWQQAGAEPPPAPKPGYVCVGDVPRLRADAGVGRGYVPHGKFEVKSLKED